MDILEALENLNIEYRQGSNEDEIWLNCPFCLEEGESSFDERFRLGINVRNGKASCFNCNKKAGGGDWIFKELARVLDSGELTALQEKRKAKKHKSNGHISLPDGFLRLYHHNKVDTKDHWFKRAYHYVISRNITESQMEDKKLGYTLIGNYSHRIIFPVFVNHKLKGFVGRDFLGTQTPPYKNSIGDKTLYNYPCTQKKTAVLLEGAIDTLVVERAAKKLDIDSLGVLGDKITISQIDMLKPYKRIILWFDPDKAGIKAAIYANKLIHENFEGKIVLIVLPLGYKHSGATDSDPDELEKEVITKRLLTAEHFTSAMQQKLQAWSAWEE